VKQSDRKEASVMILQSSTTFVPRNLDPHRASERRPTCFRRLFSSPTNASWWRQPTDETFV